MTLCEKILKQGGILLLSATYKNRPLWPGGVCNNGAKQYLVLDDLLSDLGRLGSHRLGGAEAPLGGTQPFSQRLQGFVELKSQNLQLLQLPLPEGREREGVTMISRRGRRTFIGILLLSLMFLLDCSTWTWFCVIQLSLFIKCSWHFYDILLNFKEFHKQTIFITVVFETDTERHLLFKLLVFILDSVINPRDMTDVFISGLTASTCCKQYILWRYFKWAEASEISYMCITHVPPKESSLSLVNRKAAGNYL